jgi:glyoxylase-like metal-dependent hydrolase (beta-lactamase superfamily II)
VQVHAFFDPATFTLTYVVSDAQTGDAVVIDPVLDFDPLTVTTSTTSAERVLAFLTSHHLTLRAILETHAHADHLSGAQVLREATGAPVAIGEAIKSVQAFFRGLFHRDDTPTDGRPFDHLLADGETWQAGSLTIHAIATPGHTPACMSYRIEDAVFTGDALFLPDQGTGRCDFPNGSAAQLYASVQRLYALPDATRVFVGHDYQPGGRSMAYETTIGASKATNLALPADLSQEAFVARRTSRDATLAPPKLIFPSLQVNMMAGHLPPPDTNGVRYLRLPMGVLGAT